MDLDAVIKRKFNGIDCTEEESAEVKGEIRDQIKNGVLPTFWYKLFPQETSEVFIELELI